MELKQLDKATKIYSDIQKLDSEIIEIERLAAIVSNENIVSYFDLKIVDIELENEEANMIRPLHTLSINEALDQLSKMCDFAKRKLHNHINIKPSESTTLQILAVLLNDKKKRRFDLINKLKSFGVNA